LAIPNVVYPSLAYFTKPPISLKYNLI